MRRPGHKRRPRLYVKAVKPVGGLPGGGSFPMRFASSQGDPSFCLGWGSCCVFQQLLVTVVFGLDQWPLQVVLWKQQFCCADRCGNLRLQDFTVVFSRSGADVLYCFNNKKGLGVWVRKWEVANIVNQMYNIDIILYLDYISWYMYYACKYSETFGYHVYIQPPFGFLLLETTHMRHQPKSSSVDSHGSSHTQVSLQRSQSLKCGAKGMRGACFGKAKECTNLKCGVGYLHIFCCISICA